MEFTRDPRLLTNRMRRIIKRDYILTIGIVAPLVGLLDTIWDPTFVAEQKIVVYVLCGLFLAVNLLRLKKDSLLDRKPIIAVIIMCLLLIPAVSYYSEVRTLYVIFWLVPIFVTNFYYSKKALNYVYAVFTFSILIKPYLQRNWIHSKEDYIYFVLEWAIIMVMSRFIVDTQAVTEEDKIILSDSLEKTEIEKERLGSLIASLSDGIIAVDDEGIISSYNPAAAALLGNPEKLRSGLKLSEAFQLEQATGKPFDLHTVLTKSIYSFQSRDLRIVYPNGDKALLFLNILPIMSKDDLKGAILVTRDITGERTLEDDRRSFLSILAHELRTPIATTEGALSNAQYFFDKGQTGQAMEAMKIAQEHLASLTVVNQDLELFSEVIDNRKPELELLNIADIAQLEVDKLLSAAKAKSIKLVVKLPASEAQLERSNKPWVMRIIRSLLANAIKFTDTGSVHLTLTTTETSSIIAIKDTGIGMSHSVVSKLFRPFGQAEDYTTRVNGGTGLELYIVARLVSILGGTIAVQSEPDKGTEFIVTLPHAGKKATPTALADAAALSLAGNIAV